MSVTLVDFSDLYTAICEELKVPTTDGVTLGRIKRDINMIYLDHVVPFKPRAWWWLEVKKNVQTYKKIVAGKITIADGSSTITFNTPPAISVAGYWLKVSGTATILKITAHTAAASTATIESPWQDGVVTLKGYKLWKDYVELDSTIKEVVQVTHDRRPVPVESRSNVGFDEIFARNPDFEGYPTMCHTGDYDAAESKRIIRWWPACNTLITTMKVVGRQHVSELVADSDKPLMPTEDRIVIFYGACSRAWARERNEAEATKNWNLFMMKLASMAAKSEDAPNVTHAEVDSDYVVQKRYRRLMRSPQGRKWESD